MDEKVIGQRRARLIRESKGNAQLSHYVVLLMWKAQVTDLSDQELIDMILCWVDQQIVYKTRRRRTVLLAEISLLPVSLYYIFKREGMKRPEGYKWIEQKMRLAIKKGWLAEPINGYLTITKDGRDHLSEKVKLMLVVRREARFLLQSGSATRHNRRKSFFKFLKELSK